MIKNIRLRLQKYKRREFWPGYLFDIPVYAYIGYLSIKARSIGFFSNVNPCMILSGAVGYGKHEDLDKFDQKLLPMSIFIPQGKDSEQIEQEIKTTAIKYPYIAKPTLGRTGRDVKKIHNKEELKKYLEHVHEDLLIQEFIDYPFEFGIFRYRKPEEKHGHITGIVEKKFMFLHGDGEHTFEYLVYHHPRAKYYYHQLKEEYKSKRTSVLPNGEKFQLNYIGNHCRGSTFYDVSHIITPQLETIIDDISGKVNGFYFGRYDIKAKSIEDLYKGDFKIIELNGMGSLPTHIYDPGHNLRNAYKTLFTHWDITYQISQQNKKRGIALTPLKEILKIYKKYGK